jgi:putative tryptophan/tyrosine transport system substrate-binding protein
MTGTPLRLVALALSLALAPCPADAQPVAKPARIGWVGGQSAVTASANITALREGLRDLGWVEGQNLVIEERWADGKTERIPELAGELAGLQLDLMVAPNDRALVAFKQLALGIPIVAVTCDPLDDLIAKLAAPGGDATGLTCISSELNGKRLELLKDLVPRLSRVAVLYNPFDSRKVGEFSQAQIAARKLGLSLRALEVRDAEGLAAAFEAMAAEHDQAFFVLVDPFMLLHRWKIADLALQHRLPVVFPFRDFVEVGGLMSYGTNLQATFRRAATYVDKILKGAKPGDLPVQEPTTFELAVNQKTAQALGLTIPRPILARADEVIE